MKCILCVHELLKNVVVGSDLKPVQLAVDGARQAVTTRNGSAVCTEHLHTEIVNSVFEGISTR